MADTFEYKCPNCNGGLIFDNKLQKMKCPYCDSEFDVEALKEYDTELDEKPKEETNKEEQTQVESNTDDDNFSNETNTEEQWDESDGMVVYYCKSCGGEIIGDKTMGASECPYCGNPVVIMDAFKGELKPNLVIPFKLDKEEAKRRLVNHYKGKYLLPNVFKEKNHIDEIKALYVPFWLYNAKVDANLSFKGTKVFTYELGDYRITETSFYRIDRSGSLAFDKVPVDGSSKMPNDLMESIEPYDYKDAVDFQTAYLSGFLANKFDEDAETCVPIANTRIKQSTEDSFRNTIVGYTSLTCENSNISFASEESKYAMLPVWILNTSWNGQDFLFAMNGQTGKFVGDLPVDKGKAIRLFLIVFILVTIISFLIAYFIVLGA